METMELNQLIKINDLDKIDFNKLNVIVDGVEGKISREVVESIKLGQTCVRFGRNPATGEIICLEWQ